jgi:hypothetical protein
MHDPRALHNRVQRLRVFAAVKAWMLRYGECPTGVEIAAELDIPEWAAQRHMMALAGAAGLPLPIRRDGRACVRRDVQEQKLEDQWRAIHAPVPVDDYLAALVA